MILNGKAYLDSTAVLNVLEKNYSTKIIFDLSRTLLKEVERIKYYGEYFFNQQEVYQVKQKLESDYKKTINAQRIIMLLIEEHDDIMDDIGSKLELGNRNDLNGFLKNTKFSKKTDKVMKNIEKHYGDFLQYYNENYKV